MIAYLEGEVLLKRDKFIILKVGSIGYQVFLSQKTLFTIPAIGSPIKVFTYHNIAEKASDLYGFLTLPDMEFFELLLDIHGVGPKAALEISAVGPLDKIREKILQQDENIFAGVPGIGQKKAMTILLELTGKIKLPGGKKGSTDEAESALVQLGFSKQQARDALSGISSSVTNTEERIKIALKSLGR